METSLILPMVKLFIMEQCLIQRPCLPVIQDIPLLVTLLESVYPLAIGLDMHIVRVSFELWTLYLSSGVTISLVQ